MAPLNKNNDWTELDERFKELLQAMMSEDDFEYPERKKCVDYSFLDINDDLCREDEAGIPPESSFEECINEDEIEKNKKQSESGKKNRIPLDYNRKGKNTKKGFVRAATRIAVIAMCVLLTGSGIAIWINSEPANALKFHIEKKFFELKNGGFSTEQNNKGQEDEGWITRKYTSMDDIDKAKKFMPDLPVPGYIPETYKLNELYIDKSYSGELTAEYIFSSTERKLYIDIFDGIDETQNQNLSMGDIIQEDGREICIWTDDATGKTGCSFIINNKLIHILGDIPEEDLIKIATNIYI